MYIYLYIALFCRIEPHQYQLRAYIYQARDLLAGDKNGLSGTFYFIAYLFCYLLLRVCVCVCVCVCVSVITVYLHTSIICHYNQLLRHADHTYQLIHSVPLIPIFFMSICARDLLDHETILRNTAECMHEPFTSSTAN